jgi:predicted nucleotidyltransferase
MGLSEKMPSTLDQLTKRGLIRPPSFLSDNVHYEVIMGSVAYGVSTDISDFDVNGFCIPPKKQVFPHLDGEIPGFGKQHQRFGVYQQHHINDPDALGGKGRVYDITIYSIVNYFQLCMENNPNMLDSLFVPQDCVLHITKIGNMVRDRRRSFLHKGSWHKFKGYAYSQLHKMKDKNLDPNGKRAELRNKFGFDVKFAYHTIRLLGEAEQILQEGDIDLRRNSEQLKAIRRGDLKEEEIMQMAMEKEHALERVYEESKLPWGPDEDSIKQLLVDCMEEHWGSLEGALVLSDAPNKALKEIFEIARKYAQS